MASHSAGQTSPPGTPAPAELQALHASRQRTRRGLRAMVALALVLPLLVFAALALVLRDQAFDEARARLDGVARVAQEHALKLFETNETVLERLLDIVGHAGDDEITARAAELRRRVQRMGRLPQVQGLFVHGPDGRQVLNSRLPDAPRHLDFSDRAWYRFHRAGEQGVYVSEQFISRSLGEPAFDMSRRREGPGASFAGTVHVSLKPSYLTDFYAELARSLPGLRVTLARSDGRLVARWPDGAPPGALIKPDDPVLSQILAGRDSGEALAPSPIDGVVRLRVFRRLPGYPLYVVAGLDRDVVLADWRRRCLLLALLLFPASFGIAWAGVLALKRTEEEQRATARLDDERARRQRAELALLQSQKLEAMGRLTGGVAHDFNNLLMVVSSNLHVHRRRHPEGADSPQLAAIERAVGSGAKLTRQLLAFARKQALLPERIALQERLPALLDLLRPVLGSAIEIGARVEPETRAIEVDPAEFELALINLAVNARDAMQGRGRLDIEARNALPAELPPALAAGADHVLLDVSDSGPGVAPEIAERVFEPFFTTKPLGQGTGLGLSQVQALCHSAGGSARIESRSEAEGGGARVRLFFRAAGGAPAPVPGEAAPPRALQCRVLLVEDNEAVAEATREVLESLGCTVQRVEGGEAALARVGGGGIDVVLSDIEMPGAIDGITLAARLAERADAPAVVLMTGYASRLEQAVRQRFDVLPKPCAPAVLADALARAMARRRAAVV